MASEPINDPVPQLAAALKRYDEMFGSRVHTLNADASMRPVFKAFKIMRRIRKAGFRANVIYRPSGWIPADKICIV